MRPLTLSLPLGSEGGQAEGANAMLQGEAEAIQNVILERFQRVDNLVGLDVILFNAFSVSSPALSPPTRTPRPPAPAFRPQAIERGGSSWMHPEGRPVGRCPSTL